MNEKDETEELQESNHHINNSVAVVLFRLVAAIFLTETVYALLLWLATTPVAENSHSFTIYFLWLIHTVKFFVEIGLMLAIILPWAGVSYYIDKDHLIRYVGIHRRDEKIYDLGLLQSLELHQSWLGRLFNYGELILSFETDKVDQLTLAGIFNPKKYERVLRQKLQNKGGTEFE